MTPQEVVERAFRCIGKGCVYRLGAGGMHPEAEWPWVAEEGQRVCDCSGFVCWCLGVSRFQDPHWFDTTKMVSDAEGARTLFAYVPFTEARPSDVIVYGDKPGHQGHVGVIAQHVAGEGPSAVIHCSSSNHVKHGDAIASRDPSLWFSRGGIVARCLRVEG